MRALSWSREQDASFGPFLYSWSAYRPLTVMLHSWGGGEDDNNPCKLHLSWFWGTLIIALPPIIRPWREKVYPQGWDEDGTAARLGRNWYWSIDERCYGFSYSDGFLQIRYGRSTHDSSTDHSKGYFLPWTQWRHIRRSFYDLEGHHFWSELESERWDIVRKWEEMCPKATFRLQDHDGEELDAVTHIEEREWRFGTGWFKWLSLFCRPKIRRTLDIDFSSETGPEKGSWKGGTCGTGIDMLPDELHEAAFRRYCEEEHRSKYRPYRVKFIARIS